MRKFNLVGLALACALLLPTLNATTAQTPTAATRTTATTTSAALPAAELQAAQRITAARLREHLEVVASDAMQGRDTPSKGLDDTAKYIAADLTRLGLKPAGDNNTYFQNIALVRTKVDAARTHAAFGDRPLQYGTDFLVARAAGTVASSPLVYVGNGWVVKSQSLNPYAGLDVRDKLVVVSGTGLPPGLTRDQLKGKAGDEWDDPEDYARRHGARGLISIPRTRDFDRFWRSRAASLERGVYAVERFESDAGGGTQLPTIIPSAATLDLIFANEPQTGADILRRTLAGEALPTPFALNPAKRINFAVSLANEKATTQNIVAVLEGKDATRKQEYVALGAHYDHVGTGLPVNGDAIYNGADDDGSGTVSVLTLAEAFARGPRPARSVLFVWHCGEEKGLWGSRYFTQFPTVPLAQVTAQLNIDMIGRSKPAGDPDPANRDLSGANEIYVIGSRMMSSDLAAVSERVNNSYLNLAFNYRYDDTNDPNRFFFRSDHFNYAQRGVPIIFYFDGVHADYHRPSDSVDKIDFQKMEKVARTIFITAIELANAPARPRLDKQLPQELTEH